MTVNSTKKPTISQFFILAYQTFRNKPAVYLPFVIFAILEFLSLILIFLAPRAPFREVLGPPIRAFEGERFLHYPMNFLLLPKLASQARIFLSIFAGSLLTGAAVAKLYKKPFKTALKKYLSLFLVVFIITVLFYVSVKAASWGISKYFNAGHTRLLMLGAKLWLGPILVAINLILAVTAQSLFAYAIPELILREDKFIPAVVKSFGCLKANFLKTILLVGLPMLAYLPIVVLNINTGLLIDKFFPECILLIGIVSIVVTSLIIDPLVTISTALLYEQENAKNSRPSGQAN